MALVVLLAEPEAHAVHSFAPGADCQCPAAHGAQAVAPRLPEKRPLGQAPHEEASGWATLLLYRPDSHAVHWAAPVDAHVPASQTVHAELDSAPVAALNLPAGQSVQPL